MDFEYGEIAEKFRIEFRHWLEENLDTNWREFVGDVNLDNPAAGADHPWLREWDKRLYEAGYKGIAWPEEYGGREADLMDERVGRFDPQRARARFADGFEPTCTRHVVVDGQRVGFVVVKLAADGLRLACVGAVGLALTGALALACFSKLYGVAFLGTSRTPAHTPDATGERGRRARAPGAGGAMVQPRHGGGPEVERSDVGRHGGALE